ncbi:MAG: alpha-amylase [Cyclobacteriaceae bacterium]|nr:alpha-amylase [Cyclobacteriaceae bacterium]
MRKILLSILVLQIFISCSKPKEKIPPVTPMESSSGKIVAYQIMTRLFGNTMLINEPYGTIEENGVGKMNDITEVALQSIRDLGITHIWYTGIIEHAVLTDYTKYGIPLDDADVVKGRAGSPYAIKDYYDVNPDLAVNVPDRMKEFESLVNRTHAQGLKVLIDFVPNHVARSYKSDAKPDGVSDLGETDDQSKAFSPANNFYYLPGQSFQVPREYQPLGGHSFPTKDGKYEEMPAKVTGNDQFTATPGVNEWFETVKLNYGVDIQDGRKTYFDPIPDTWIKMKDILIFWAGKNIDGFRCDMAEMVPVEFWNWAIPQVKAIYPEIIFVAEIYNPDQYKNYIYTGRFDYLYDKVQLYDTLRFLINGHRTTRDIHPVQQALADISDHMLHFLENHDEQRIASRFFAGDPWKALPAMVVSATIDRGPVMVYFGQEVGEPGAGVEGFQGDDGRTTIFDYWGVPEHQKWMNNGKFDGGQLSDEQKQLRHFYATLLNLAAKNQALAHGKYLDLTEANIQAGNFDDKVHAFIRYYGEEKLLVVTSFGKEEINIHVQLTSDAVAKLSLDPAKTNTARDMLLGELEIRFDSNFRSELSMKPYGTYIFKIQ